MAHLVKNKTRQQITLQLPGGNAVTLLPFGSTDITGPVDRTVLLDGEETSPDVQNNLESGNVSIEPVVAQPPASSDAQATSETGSGKSKGRGK